MNFSRSSILVLFLYYLTFCTFFLAVVYSFLPSSLVIFAKDGAILCLLLLVISGAMVSKYSKHIGFELLFAFFPLFIVVAIAFLISEAPIFARFASARQILVPYLLILFGYVCGSDRETFAKALKTIFYCCVFLVCFGFFERFINLWQYVDIATFFKSKNIAVFSNGYPVMFVEPISIFGLKSFDFGIYRMVSTFLDPINLGHALVACFTLLYFYSGVSNYKAKVLLFFVFLCVFLTFSKSAILQFFLVFLVFNPSVKIVFKFVFCLVSVLPIYLFIIYHPGFEAHFLGFVNIFHYLSFFGDGLASFGNYSLMFNSSSLSLNAGVSDSYWSSLLGQLGIFGFSIWLLTNFFVVYLVRNSYPLAVLYMTQFIISVLSENTFNLMSVAYLCVFIGVYIRGCRLNFVITKNGTV